MFAFNGFVLDFICAIRAFFHYALLPILNKPLSPGWTRFRLWKQKAEPPLSGQLGYSRKTRSIAPHLGLGVALSRFFPYFTIKGEMSRVTCPPKNINHLAFAHGIMFLSEA